MFISAHYISNSIDLMSHDVKSIIFSLSSSLRNNHLSLVNTFKTVLKTHIQVHNFTPSRVVFKALSFSTSTHTVSMSIAVQHFTALKQLYAFRKKYVSAFFHLSLIQNNAQKTS